MSLRISYRRTESPLSKSERQADLVLDSGEDFDGHDGRLPYPWDLRNPPMSLRIAYRRHTWYCTVVRTLTVMMVMYDRKITCCGFRVSGFGFRVSGFGFRVTDFGIWVS